MFEGYNMGVFKQIKLEGHSRHHILAVIMSCLPTGISYFSNLHKTKGNLICSDTKKSLEKSCMLNYKMHEMALVYIFGIISLNNGPI